MLQLKIAKQVAQISFLIEIPAKIAVYINTTTKQNDKQIKNPNLSKSPLYITNQVLNDSLYQ